MFLKKILSLLALVMIAAICAVGTTTADDEQMNKDPISGEWDVSFFVQGHTTPATFNLKLDGNKVTGTANSDHTGPGTLRDGSWIDNKLTFTIDFAKHESIAINGHLDHEKLVGEFTTEGFTAKWEAKKKAEAKSETATAAAASGNNAIAGEWQAVFATEGMEVPITLSLQVEGGKITGTTNSPHMGAGKITNGTLNGADFNFDIEGAPGTVKATVTLDDGKMAGSFSFGPRNQL